MSSILKALKKLETETAGQSELQTPDTRSAIHRHVKGIWLLNKLMTILITILCVIGSVGILYTWKPDLIRKLHPYAVSQDIAKETTGISSTGGNQTVVPNLPTPSNPGIPESSLPAAVESKPAFPSASADPSTKPPAAEPIPATAPKTYKPVIIVKTDLKPVQNTEPTDIDADEPESEQPPETESVPEISEQDEPAAPEPSDSEQIQRQVSESAKTSPDETSYDQAVLMTDGRLKIQALVWSNNPDSRFAVINDRVVKHGGFINDLCSVAYIGNNYVIVNEGAKQWKVEFQLK